MNPESELEAVRIALNEADVAVGNEHMTYSLADRVRILALAKDYFLRQCDEARNRLAKASSPVTDNPKEDEFYKQADQAQEREEADNEFFYGKQD